MSGSDIAAIFQGAIVTVTLSLIGILIGLPIGLGLALIRWANVPIAAGIVTLYVSMLRATPLVTLLLLLFFALPNIGVPINPISAAVAALDRTAPGRGGGRRMIHDFGIVWNERALLLSGLANTAILSTLAAVAALLLGFVLTPALMSKQRAVSSAARVFVDGMRCVPFLLFAYIVYYGFPSFGVRLDNWTSGLAALTIYNAAYMAEILRGAWVVQPREPIEAGIAFGVYEIKLVGRLNLPPRP